MDVSTDVSREFLLAVGAGVLVGILVTTGVMGLIGTLTDGGGATNQLAGETIRIGGEIRDVNATNDTLLLDTPDSPAGATAIDISETGPLVCTADGEFSCQLGTPWRSIEPGSQACAVVGIPETGAPAAQQVAINATCTTGGVA